MKRKTLAIFALLIFSLLFSTGCSDEIEYEIVFGAKVSVAITRNMNSSAKSFITNYMQLEKTEDMEKAIVECIFNYGEMDLERHVFVVGQGGEFFEDLIESKKGVTDELTGLYVVDYGDINFLKNEELKINTKKVFELYGEYIKTEDASLIGIETEAE